MEEKGGNGFLCVESRPHSEQVHDCLRFHVKGEIFSTLVDETILMYKLKWTDFFSLFPPTHSGQRCGRAEGFWVHFQLCLSMWNVHVLFVPMWVFPRYSSTLFWSWTENGGMCTSSLQLCIQQPDLILLHKHVSSGFAPLLLASSSHLWARTHNESVQAHLQKHKSYFFLSEFEGLLRKRSVWQQNLSKSYDTNIFPIFFYYSCIQWVIFIIEYLTWQKVNEQMY